MSLRPSLLTTLLICGCNSDGLVVGNDGAASVDASYGPGLDIAMPEVDDLAMPDLATPDLAMASKMWIRQFGTPASDDGRGVATDNMGNIYVTGFTDGGLDGNQNAGLYDAFLIKYDANGNKLWTRQFGTQAKDAGSGVATDGVGNIYVTGYTDGSLDGNQNTGFDDILLAKYDANGNKLWTRQLGTWASDDGLDVATDGAGNVYVAGYTQGGLDGNQNAGLYDAFLVKYDAKGNKLWTRQFGTAEDDFAYGVATDGMRNVYVTGATSGALDGNQKAGPPDAFLVKYDANGNKIWTRLFGTADYDVATGVATDGVGNIYVTGYTDGSLDGNQNAGYGDAFLIKYDVNGNKVWARQFGTPSNDAALGVATDAAGNANVVGWTGGGLDGNQNAGYGDAFLIKYDANGKKLWTRQFGTPDGDQADGVATDGAGRIYVTGGTGGAFAGNQTAGYTDAFLAQFLAAP